MVALPKERASYPMGRWHFAEEQVRFLSHLLKIMNIAKMLGVKEFPFIITNKNGDIIYYEEAPFNDDECGYWERYEYDDEGNEILHESLIQSSVKLEDDENYEHF